MNSCQLYFLDVIKLSLSISKQVCQDFTKTSFSCENTGPALWSSQVRLHWKSDIHLSHNSIIETPRPPSGSEEPPQDRAKLIHQSNVNFFTKICCHNQSRIEVSLISWRGSYVFSQWAPLIVVTVVTNKINISVVLKSSLLSLTGRYDITTSGHLSILVISIYR